jgi:hypothetical protein
MGFQKFIFTENQTGSGANTLNGRGGLPALSTISANTDTTSPAIRINQTVNQALTCYVTAASFALLTSNGAPIFTGQNSSVFSFNDDGNVFPFKLYYNASEYNTLDYRLSATGQDCASGVQIGAVYWSLSTTALSSTSAGTTIPVEVTNAGMPVAGYDGATFTCVISAQTQVFCVNTGFPAGTNEYLCQGEFLRKQYYLG